MAEVNNNTEETKNDYNSRLEERNRVFRTFLKDDDLSKVIKYFLSRKVPYLPDDNVIKASIYKLIYNYPDFTEEEQELAKKKCEEIGESIDIKGVVF